MVDDRAAAIVERNAERQRALGVDVRLLDRSALARQFPAIRNDDLTLAAWTRATAGSTPMPCCRAFARRPSTWVPCM